VFFSPLVQSLLSTPITALRNEGEDTISSETTHKRTLSMDHAKERRLKLNVRRRDPFDKGVVRLVNDNDFIIYIYFMSFSTF